MRITRDTIQAVSDRLREAAPDATIILFGSWARATEGSQSDLDILVVRPTVSAQRREAAELYRAVRDVCAATEVIVISHASFAERSQWPGTVYHAAAREGRVLYDPSGALPSAG